MVQMGMVPPRPLIERFYKALHGAQNVHDASVIFQLFMQLASLPDKYCACMPWVFLTICADPFAHHWAPVGEKANQHNLDNISITLADVTDTKHPQRRHNSILWLRYLVAMFQRDIVSVPVEQVMLRRLGDATGNTSALIQEIMDALQEAINLQENDRKAWKHKESDIQDELEAAMAKAKDDAEEIARLQAAYEKGSEERQRVWRAKHVHAVEVVLLLQKLFSIVRHDLFRFSLSIELNLRVKIFLAVVALATAGESWAQQRL
jgi:hypothetical protein